MSQFHPGGRGELAAILPALLRSTDLSQSMIPNIDINRGPHGTILIFVPTLDAVQLRTQRQHHGIKTVISWLDHKWITVWCYGVQIRQLKYGWEIKCTNLVRGKLSYSGTCPVTIEDPVLAQKFDGYSDNVSKSQTISVCRNLCTKDQDCEVHSGDCSLD